MRYAGGEVSTLASATPAVPLPAVGDSTAPRVAAWPLLAVAFASTSIIVGGIWDISWHRSIGRDSFWTLAHMAIYLGGIVAESEEIILP